ncbi:MAG: ABC transporter permease [Nitrospirae bacterium]|nr:ABC transporter permease [Nitrospirota bacterium]
MGLLLQYSIRNILRRRLTTTLTSLGMALVVFVFAAVLMLSDGLRKTLVTTGAYDNVVVLRKSAGVEVQSSMERADAAIIEGHANAALDVDGVQLIAKELVVLISLDKRISNKPSNVVIRGVNAKSFALRTDVRLVQGRLPRAGSTEIIVGKSIEERFNGVSLGQRLHLAMRDWIIVGVFDAGNRGFSSEIWGDADVLMQSFRRNSYSSIIFKLRDSGSFESISNRIKDDPRLKVDVKRENKYYEEQSEMMAKFLTILGLSLTLIFSIGAVIGAMITMYTACATRTAEVGTLRALGFQRTTILMAFIAESLFLGGVGGGLGLLLASFLQLFTVSTMNWQTFSELAFSFDMNLSISVYSLAFSLFMGLTAGVLPALKAARMNIVDSLRAV